MKKITHNDLYILRKSFFYNLENIQKQKVTREEYKLMSEALVKAFKNYNRDLEPLV